MRCWWCKSEMFWMRDEDCEDGVNPVLGCPNCMAEAVFTQPGEEE